jgi:hypothetical protein
MPDTLEGYEVEVRRESGKRRKRRAAEEDETGSGLDKLKPALKLEHECAGTLHGQRYLTPRAKYSVTRKVLMMVAATNDL